MHQVCLHCQRVDASANLFCEQRNCPAEQSPLIFEAGETLGDLTILRRIVVLSTATVYAAEVRRQRVLLKVAHPGQPHTDRLTREAQCLHELQSQRIHSPQLPTLLPPYINCTLETSTVGRAMVRDRLVYYTLFEHVAGEPLRALLDARPQLWIYHVGWLMLSVASAVALLQSRGWLHLGLNPDTLLVRIDARQGVPRPLLLDLGVAADMPTGTQHWYPGLVGPAYQAPELRAEQVPSYAADVYGLGLILYELLAGKPAFAGAETEHGPIGNEQRVELARVADVQPVAELALQALDPDPAARPAEASALAQQLLQLFGPVPPERTARLSVPDMVFIAIIALLTLTFVIAGVSSLWALLVAHTAFK